MKTGEGIEGTGGHRRGLGERVDGFRDRQGDTGADLGTRGMKKTVVRGGEATH